MSKDPSFLFYTNDFLTGCFFMSDEQVGKYIRLLCLQHQTGHLKKEHMIKICGTYDKDVFGKFKQDENGLYYNERLDTEINKRNNYCESRRKNRTYEKHMLLHMENEDEDSIKERIQGEEKQLPINNVITPKLFETFWKLYPKKIDKGKALSKWNLICTRKNISPPTWKQIRVALHDQKKSERWEDKTFIPHPTTWLSQQRWLDDPKEMKNFTNREEEKEKFEYVDGIKYAVKDKRLFHAVTGEYFGLSEKV